MPNTISAQLLLSYMPKHLQRISSCIAYCQAIFPSYLIIKSQVLTLFNNIHSDIDTFNFNTLTEGVAESSYVSNHR